MSTDEVTQPIESPTGSVDDLVSAVSPGVLAGAMSLVGLGILALVRIGLNLPASAPLSGLVPSGGTLSAAYPLAVGLATAAPAAGLLLLGLRAERTAVLVGGTFAGVFGGLSMVARPATLPATLAIGGALLGVAADRAVRVGQDRAQFGRAVVGSALALGGILSLLAGVGVEPATLRPLGTGVVLLAVAGSPAFAGWDRQGLLVGLGAGAAVLAVGSTAPFVTGAVSLVVGGAVGASLPLLFLAAVGATSLLWSGLRRGRWTLALAASLLLVAGIPATVPRGLGFLVALVLLGGVDR